MATPRILQTEQDLLMYSSLFPEDENARPRGLEIEKKIEFLESLAGNVRNRRSRRWLNDRLLMELVPRLNAEEIRGLFAPPPWGDDVPQSAFSKTDTGDWDKFRNIDMDKEASIIESLENSSSKRRGGQDAEKVAVLTAWHRVDSRTRDALRRCYLSDLVHGYEECIRSFVEDTGNKDVLVLHVQDPFHRLLLHGVCEFYNLVSTTINQSNDGKSTKMTRIRKKQSASMEIPNITLCNFLKMAKEGFCSASPQTMEEEIKSEFIRSGFTLENEEDVLQKCLSLCIQYKFSASDIVANWDLYSINRGLDSTVRSSHMGAFLEQLQNEQMDKVREKASGLHLYSNDVAMILNGNFEETDAILDTTPDKQALAREKSFDSAQKTNSIKLTSAKPLESVTPFGSRKNKYVVQSTLNEHLNMQTIKVEDNANSEDEIIKRVQPSKKCSLTLEKSQPEPGCRFMYDRIEDKFNFLENCIKKRATAYVSSRICDEPVDPSVASQKSIFAVGMICCEEEGRLKEKPILLQSSVEHSGGQRVRLDLQKLNQFSVFPGQVVGVEGHNPSGHCLIASNIFDYVPLSAPTGEEHPSKKQALDHNLQLSKTLLDTPEVSMIVAAGPFTTSDNLLFEPLTDLLAYARRKQPQLLVLLGPFIDSDHPELMKGTINLTFDEMFRHEILGKLQDYVEYMGSAVDVILIPSIRDANHDFVFPQPAFDIRPADFSHQINSVSNPGLFCANQVKVACCTIDILKHLSAEEICRNPPGGSKQRLTNLAKHILNQRSFYPLYPPSEDVPLDFSLASKALHFSSIPDILVLPSDLAHFVKVVSIGSVSDGEEQVKCICVNPGRLARGEGGGFFVEINYKGNPDSSNASVIRI